MAEEAETREIADESAASLLTRHMPGLDLTRGLAILVVVFYHGFTYSAPWLQPTGIAGFFFRLTGWGWLGVNLFFILSGFLITGLLHDSAASENYYRRFYIRRALRILPAYLATLLLIWALHMVRLPYVVVCIFFLANMPGLFLKRGYYVYGPLWSLAVEEQFYLVWPFLLRRFRRKGMLVICAVLILLCPLLRWLAAMHLVHMGEPNSKTWMIADNLAMGAALALLARVPQLTRRHFAAIGGGAFAVGVLGVTVLALVHGLIGPLGSSVGLSCFMLIGVGLVTWMLCTFRIRPVPRGLRFLIFFGDISYGLYLVHMLCMMLYDRFFGTAALHDLHKLAIRFVIANAVAVAMATLSRKTFEQWFLDRKRTIRAAA